MEKQNKKQHAAPVRCFVHTAAVTYRCVFHAGAVLGGDQWGVQFKRAPMKTHDTCSMRDNAVTSHNKLSDYLWNYHGTSLVCHEPLRLRKSGEKLLRSEFTFSIVCYCAIG